MDNKYKYTYEKTADYCYKDTDVLINKLNITNDEDLFNAERELVSLRTYELNEKPLGLQEQGFSCNIRESSSSCNASSASLQVGFYGSVNASGGVHDCYVSEDGHSRCGV